MAKRINLETFAGGALSEIVNRELMKINRNIHDPNTKADKDRTLTVTIKLKPDESRRLVMAEIFAKASLAPANAAKTTLVTGIDLATGDVEMSEYGNEGQIRGQMAVDGQGRVYDPETGEIPEETAAKQPKNIRDLRRTAQ